MSTIAANLLEIAKTCPRSFFAIVITTAAQAHIAVVEIEPDTFNLKILDAVVDACGRVVNHTIVRGQVLGSTRLARRCADGAAALR